MACASQGPCAMSRYKSSLRERARALAVEAYGLSRSVQQQFPALRSAGDQLFRAASSIGANLAESEGLNTRKELAARYSIALKESKETLYWLQLIERAEVSLEPRAAPLIAECKEFIAMMTSGLQKLRS